MNYETLKASIQAVIKANGNEEITGPILQQTLIAIVNALGTGYQFLGIADSGTTLGTPDQRVYYVAFAYGTSIEIGDFTIEDEICILKYDEEWTKAQIAAIDTEPTDGSDNLVTSGGVAIAIDEALRLIENAYAKKEGVYPGIVAGSAQSLLNPVALAGSFLFRPTGDGAAIGKGRAVFSELRGKSLVWNQRVADANIAFSVNYSTEGNAAQLPGYYSLISAHKYLVYVSFANNVKQLRFRDITEGITSSWEVGTAFIYTASTSSNGTTFVQVIGTVLGTVSGKINIYDLTLMYGAGNEPATVADFQKDFPLPYYAHNAGKVIPFAAQDYETTGFNQWDEEWEVGSINISTGADASSTTTIRAKNYDKCLPSTDYCLHCASANIILFFYDADKNFISSISAQGVNTNRVVTSPANAAFFRVRGAEPDYGNTYNHDICINLSGPRNGEYEPYKKTTLHLNPAGWVDPSDNYIYPYGGMHGVGSAFDFARVDADGWIRKATRVFGVVDLGTLEWSDAGTYATTPKSAIGAAASNALLLCDKLTIISSGVGSTTMSLSQNTTHINVNIDNDGSHVASGTSGIYLVYQLATPVELTLDEPVKAYTDVDGNGTEAWKPDNTTDPYTTPCNVSIFYPLDIAGGVISAQSFANFCSELSTKLGAALNKTISIAATYNAATEQYGYTITIA